MKKAHRLLALLAMLSLPLAALAATIQAPTEVMASAPNGTHVLAFSKSGDQADADAAAVFETPPDKEGVRYRTLVFFHKQDGRFVPDLTSDRLIACSKCSQFHDDPFEPEQLEVKPLSSTLARYLRRRSWISFVEAAYGTSCTPLAELSIGVDTTSELFRLRCRSQDLPRICTSHGTCPCTSTRFF